MHGYIEQRARIEKRFSFDTHPGVPPMTSLTRIVLTIALLAAAGVLRAQTDPNGSPLGNPNGPASAGSPNSQATPGVLRPGALGADSSLNSSGGVDAQAMQDKLFLRKAAQGGAAQILLGQLALQKTSNDSVKRFAQRMIDDHTAITQSLKSFADELGVLTPKPTKADQQEHDRLAALSGSDFDREYLADMVKDHHKDLQDFTLEADSATDADLKEAVARDRVVIARHARMADRLAAAQVAGNK